MTKVQDKHVMVDFAGVKRGSSSRKGDDYNASGSVQYEPSMSVFLGNLPLDVEEEEIITLFNEADHLPQVQGEVDAVRVVHDKATGLGKGFGYVLFKSTKAAKAALDLNGHKVKDREVRVMKVNPPNELSKNANKTATGGSGSKKDKRNKLSAFQRRSSNKDGGKPGGKPSWQGMKAKSKIGKAATAKDSKNKKKNPLLSKMVKKHTIKSTTKNMQSRKKTIQNQVAKKREKHDAKGKKRINKKARK
jgi:nucleolar protein 12